MPYIFLSYRRDDAAEHARRLRRDLESRFGPMTVQIIHGRPSEAGVAHAVGAAAVVLAVIGPRWFGLDAVGRRRIDDPEDWVRQELATALHHAGLRVIPVLVGGATAPEQAELPEALRPLARRKGIELRDMTWQSDVGEFADWLAEKFGPFAPPTYAPSGDRQLNEPTDSPPDLSEAGAAAPGIYLEDLEDDALRLQFARAASAGIVPALRAAAPPHGGTRHPVRDSREDEHPLLPNQPDLVPNQPDSHEILPSKSDRPGEAPPPATPRSPPPPLEQATPSRRPTAPPPIRSAPRKRWGFAKVVPLGLVGVGVATAAFVLARWWLGWLVAAEPGERSDDTVMCTVFAPLSVAPGYSLLVQAFLHLPEQAADAAAIAAELDTDAHRRTFRSLQTPVPLGARLDFELRMPGLAIDEPLASLVWNGRAEAVQFEVRVPPGTPEGAVIGTLEVSLAAAPIGNIKFKLTIDRAAMTPLNEPQGERANRYTAAFISYASQDRDKVLARVQMLSAVGIKFFQDILDLEPGDRWAKKLELGIDECDVFLLFWSNESKRSEWVRKEVRYALDRRGEDELAPPEIRPVILEGPPIVEPWEELAHLHFNDRLLYFMQPRPLSSGPTETG
jgi:hypothetical protein